MAHLPMTLSEVKVPVVVDGVEYSNGPAATKAILASGVKAATATIKFSAGDITVNVEVGDYVLDDMGGDADIDEAEFTPATIKEVYIKK